MDLSRQSPAPARYVGIGLVVALHLAAIYALSAGLMRPLVKHDEVSIRLPRLPDKPQEPEQDPKPIVKGEKPNLVPVPIPVVQPTVEWIEAPTISTEALRGDANPPAGGNAGTGSPPQVAPAQQQDNTLRSPGAVCSVMPRPEVPTVNWAGEAVLQVIATVRGGRVVGTDFRVSQGALDGKTKRSLQRSVETALSGYQCQGDAVFQQEFAFRID